MEKRCFKCRRVKPFNEYYKHSEMADGHLNKCKACTKKDVKRRYYDPEARPRIKEYERERSQQPTRKAKIAEYNKNKRGRTAEKLAARAAVNNSIRDGKLIREPCKVCGDIQSQGHHTDYGKPLEVQWLCFRHHREAHGQVID